MNNTTTTTIRYDYLSTGKYSAAVAALWISATLSILGSGTILFIRWKSHSKRPSRSTIYDRLIAGISLVDLMVSLALLFNPIVLPQQQTNLKFARGNFATCEWAGFFLYFFLGGTVYNGALAFYFLLNIRYYKNERQIAKLLEPYVHVIAFGLPLAVSTVAVVQHNINPHALYGTCLLSPYPPECLLDDTVDCQRGENDAALTLVVVATQAIFGLGGIVCTGWVFWTVRQQTNRVDQRFRNSITVATTARSSSSSSNCPTTTTTSTESRGRSHALLVAIDHAKRKQLKTVGMQAVYYILAYLNGFVWIVFANVVEAMYIKDLETFQAVSISGDQEPLLYAAFFLLLFFFPMQGFFNAIIYIRPRLLRWKDANPQQTWIWAFRQVLTGTEVPITRRTAHLNMKLSANPTTTTDARIEEQLHHHSAQSGFLSMQDLAATTSTTNNNNNNMETTERLGMDATECIDSIHEDNDNNERKTATSGIQNIDHAPDVELDCSHELEDNPLA